MRKTFLLLSILAISGYVWSQGRQGGGGGMGGGMGEEIRKMVTDTSGVVTGIIVDSKSGEPLEYATVAIFSNKDTSLISGGITNEDGRFAIGRVPYGKFILRAEFIGYESTWVYDKTLEKSRPVQMLGKIKVSPGATMIEGVEITAQKEMIQTNLDKKVFNVAQDLTSMGGSAVDVMQTIPAVQVDIDGNVSIRGSGSITILIDGRPTNLELEQIPAETIESIEVVTNPSARYDPDGISGIINVVLKKEKKPGFNGMITANLGIGELENKFNADKGNLSLNLNYRYNKINTTFAYNVRKMTNRFIGDLYRETTFRDTTLNQDLISILDQDMHGKFNHQFHNVRFGIDYFLNKKTTLFFNGSYGHRQGDRYTLTNTSSQRQNPVREEIYDQNNYSENGGNRYELAAGFIRTFETKGKEWTADFLFSDGENDNISELVEEYYLAPEYEDVIRQFYQNTENSGNRMTVNAQTDFVTPIGNGGRLETGYKFTIRERSNIYNLFSGEQIDNIVEDLNKADDFTYTDYLHSAYVIYSNTLWEKLKYQGGLRIENANIIADSRSMGEKYKNHYLNIFPTAHIRYEPSDKSAMQLSYSRRVSRPSMWVINPFVDYSDRLNLSKGNPKLQPEFINSLELSHYLFLKSTSINTTVFYRNRTDIITRFTTLLNDSTTMMTYDNVDKSTSYGAELVVSQTLAKWWKLTLSGSMYQNSYNSSIALDPDLLQDFNWNARLMSIFNIKKYGDLQLSANYRSPMVTIGTMGFMRAGVGQGRMSATYSMDLGGKVNLWKDNLHLRFRVSDMFAWWKLDAETNGIDFYSHSTRQRESRVIWIGFSYKFNDYRAVRERRKANGMDEEPDDM